MTMGPQRISEARFLRMLDALEASFPGAAGATVTNAGIAAVRALGMLPPKGWD